MLEGDGAARMESWHLAFVSDQYLSLLREF